MSFPNSAGAYGEIIDRSFIVNGSGLLAGGIVVTSKRGPTEITTVTSATEMSQLFGNPSIDTPSMFCAMRFLARGNILSVKRVIVDAQLAEGEFIVGASPILSVTAANEGAWGNKISVSFEPVEIPSFNSVAIVIEEDGVIVEKFEVSRDPDARNGFGSSIFIEDVVNRRSRYIRVDDDPSVAGNYPLGTRITLAGGADDTIGPSSGDIIAAWDEFLAVEKIPANLLINAGFATPAIQQKMLFVAEERRDAVAILDIPEDRSTSVSDMVSYRKIELGADTFYGAIYGGWVKVYDPQSDREITIPPSGDVAGIYLHTATVANRWDAPAGLQRGIIPNAVGLSLEPNEAERDLLYINGINPIVKLAGANAIVWGQKSLQLRASALDRMNVVNLVLWMNNRMIEALRPFVFEPNTKFTRDSANYMLSSFLGDIKKRGGLYDFYVDSSDQLNTPEVIDQNQMLINVFIKPVKSSEYIRVATIIAPTGVSLSSLQ